ncbi:MAG TPA: TrmH family RNA methyltransferase, partial [Chloroflexota bacterium]|nr:TrmH family RNA methyltransferase [Chloroflexota bacterium]
MITSPHNAKLQLLRSLQQRKHRQATGRTLIEGVRLMQEALAAEVDLDPIVVAPERLSATAAGRALRQRLERLPQVEQTEDHLLRSVSDTVTSQGVLAAAAITPPKPAPVDGLVLVLDGIADPGNAGTMLRTARAAGVDTVLSTPSTVDLWSSKVVRAGMGAHFHLNLCPDADLAELAGREL